jgi:ABC-type multidrug transport system fused ATPase/permease subunit
MFSIQIKNVTFSYNDKEEVFRNHSLTLDVSKSNPHNLYGIIGPSGTGKTTLISILGGQLNPQSGEALIDNVDIYQVDDLKRRELIAVQMQTATNLRGKLKYNLLFGLPQQDIYSDEELVTILKKVGLWSIFEPKEGLMTMIGEGGLNLSGGQRQRLNFAGLYLRAKYFKPHLILIDEPTSSLDEISELAITDMIMELSQIAVTFVVAHRLKTLEQAIGILDSSLIGSQKQLVFYSRNELQNISNYYQDLMSGKRKLED